MLFGSQAGRTPLEEAFAHGSPATVSALRGPTADIAPRDAARDIISPVRSGTFIHWQAQRGGEVSFQKPEAVRQHSSLSGGSVQQRIGARAGGRGALAGPSSGGCFFGDSGPPPSVFRLHEASLPGVASASSFPRTGELSATGDSEIGLAQSSVFLRQPQPPLGQPKHSLRPRMGTLRRPETEMPPVATMRRTLLATTASKIEKGSRCREGRLDKAVESSTCSDDNEYLESLLGIVSPLTSPMPASSALAGAAHAEFSELYQALGEAISSPPPPTRPGAIC